MSEHGWTDAQVTTLKRLHSRGLMFYTEMAPLIGKPVQLVRWKAKQLGLVSTRVTLQGRFGQWNAKHAHLRLAAMTYFLTHTAEQCQKKFKLTASEFKSLCSVSYKMPEYKHLRKETRDHSPWSTKQLKFLLRHAGLRPRKWVAEQIGRGNDICIKERLQSLGLSSRTLQGITLSQFRQAFGKDPDFYLQTDAGPSGNLHAEGSGHWKIIPWVWLDGEIKAKRLRAPKIFRQLIEARAEFQEWIFGGNALRKMKRIVCKVSA